MPEKRKSSSRKNSRVGTGLSTRTKKQIDSLPTHAQHIFKKHMQVLLKSIRILPKDEEAKGKVQKKSLIKRRGLLSRKNIKSKEMNG
jgi:hypothetical protein